MISKDEIKRSLRAIANSNELQGEMVDLAINELTYVLYNYQIDIANAVQESNLSTAVLLNSKIRNCMEVMYSIYRGRNARVNLAFTSDTLINKDKFDLLYTSNTFKVYADDIIDIAKTDEGSTDIQEVTGILSTRDIFDTTIEVSANTRYYIDVKMDRTLLSNLSEDILVYIDGQLYPTTRNFFDHIQKSMPLNNYDAYIIGNYYYYVEDGEWKSISIIYPGPSSGYTEDDYQLLIKSLHSLGELDSTLLLPDLKYGDQSLDYIFVLTIPDYGIRLYKRGNFDYYSKVRVKAFQYTSLDQINPDEFRKIIIPGTKLVFNDQITELSIDNIVRKGSKLNGAIRELPRDSARSILYNANMYQRLQSTILSNSDINMLFDEHFIDRVSSSINWYLGEDEHEGDNTTYTNTNNGTLFIFYVPKVDGDEISEDEVDEFKVKYASHFITSKIVAVPGVLCEINVSLSLINNVNETAIPEVESILNGYSNKLNDPSQFERVNDLPVGARPDPTINNLLNYKMINSLINKLSMVEYIDEIIFEYADSTFIESLGMTFDGNIYSEYRHPLYEDGKQYMPTTLMDENVTSTTYGKEYESLLVPTYYKFNISNQKETYKYADLS